MSEWRAICCPVDLSEASHVALQEAAALARRSGARVVMLHVLGGSLAESEPIFAPPPRRAAPEPAEAGRRLEAWAAEAERTSGRPVSALQVQGPPVPEILRIAEEQGCDLIVLGKHPHGTIGRLFRRSVAERVARRATLPVLLVPDPAGRARAAP